MRKCKNNVYDWKMIENFKSLEDFCFKFDIIQGYYYINIDPNMFTVSPFFFRIQLHSYFQKYCVVLFSFDVYMALNRFYIEDDLGPLPSLSKFLKKQINLSKLF